MQVHTKGAKSARVKADFDQLKDKIRHWSDKVRGSCDDRQHTKLGSAGHYTGLRG